VSSGRAQDLEDLQTVTVMALAALVIFRVGVFVGRRR
jgi:hypothetical protein